MPSVYDLVAWAYYATHARKAPDPARYVLGQSGWVAAGARVLDYGGGEGRWAAELAGRAAAVVVADIDEAALRRVPSHPRLASVLVDGHTLPFRSQVFDVVFINHVLHHVEDLPAVLPELRRVVRRRGRLVIIEFHPEASLTRVYRFLSHFRRHPCIFYAPRALATLVNGATFRVEAHGLDEFQYALVASREESDGGLADRTKTSDAT